MKEVKQNLEAALLHVKKTVSKDETRYFMTGVYLDGVEDLPDLASAGVFKDNNEPYVKVLVATTGYALSALFLTQSTLDALSRGQKLENGFVDIDTKALTIRPSIDPIFTGAQFPNWRKVVPGISKLVYIATLRPADKSIGLNTNYARWCMDTGFLLNSDNIEYMPVSDVSIVYGTDTSPSQCQFEEAQRRPDAKKAVCFVSLFSFGRLVTVVMPIMKD